ncbi:transposase [Sorangium sp. So ce176]|uniref:transposase n=1 Tax=Sorangium sp. So ce176 TaxID=3133286 RepID=UPI003F61766B
MSLAIASLYRGCPIALLLDENRSHKAHFSQRLTAILDLTLFWLPMRCTELSPMDHLWRAVKEELCASHQDVKIDV